MTHAPSTGLSRWQLASRTGSHAGRDPGPDYRQVALPALRPSGFAPSLERGGEPGSPSARGLRGDPLVAAQSPSFPPGKLKLSCSDFNRGLKDKLTRSLTHTEKDKDRDTHTSLPRRESELCAANVWGAFPTPEQERRASDLPPGLHGGQRGLNMPRGFTGGQGANAVTRPDSRGSRWPGRQQAESRRGRGNGPPLLTGWAGGPESSLSPSGAETVALTLLTGLPLSPGSQRSRMAKGQQEQKQRPEPWLQGGRPAQSQPGHPKGARDALT